MVVQEVHQVPALPAEMKEFPEPLPAVLQVTEKREFQMAFFVLSYFDYCILSIQLSYQLKQKYIFMI